MAEEARYHYANTIRIFTNAEKYTSISFWVCQSSVMLCFV